MAKTVEGKIQDKAIKYAHSKAVNTIRLYFGPGMNTGWPDVLFLIPGGKPLFIEFKAPGNEPTKKQWAKINLLMDLKYTVCWVNSFEQAKKNIDWCLEERK